MEMLETVSMVPIKKPMMAMVAVRLANMVHSGTILSVIANIATDISSTRWGPRLSCGKVLL